MDLLFKHLGINTQPDLKQGQSFNHGIRQFSADPTYNLLQEGSSFFLNFIHRNDAKF